MFFFSFTLGFQSSLVAGVMADVQFYHPCTFSASTDKTYGSYFRVYNRFCVLLGIALTLTPTGILCMYAAFLIHFLLPQSVCLYVNFVGLIHKENGLLNPLVNNRFISSVIRGIICRVCGPCLLITIDILLGL